MVIAVADRGPGIAPEDREAIFEPFWLGGVVDGPASGSRSRAASPSERRPDHGRIGAGPRHARFSLVLPAVELPGEGVGVSGPRLLVVDDEPEILSALEVK